MLTDETYETIMERARRLGMRSPGEVANYALVLFAQLVDELGEDGQLLIQHDCKVHGYVLRDAVRAGGRPLRRVELLGSERPTLRLPHPTPATTPGP